MGTEVYITVYCHDNEKNETLTLKEFVKRFNNEEMSDAIFSIQAVAYDSEHKQEQQINLEDLGE